MSTRWGVLSTGRIGRTVIAANPGRFHAVAGRDPARTAAFAADTGLRQTFPGYAEMLASDEIDAVHVALPNSMHTEWTVRALEAGKHVLCEKPFAWDPADAARCFDTAAAHDRLCAEGFMWGTQPQTRLARQLLADGVIGRLATIRATLRVTVGVGDIRRSTDPAGGSLGDLGCYCAGAIRLFGGEPSRVTAEAVFDGVDLRLCGMLRCADDVIGSFDSGLDQPRADELQLVGTEGVIRIPDPWLCREGRVEVEGKGTVERMSADPDGRYARTGSDHDAYRIEFDVFEAAIAGSAPLPCGRDDAVAQATTPAGAAEIRPHHAASRPVIRSRHRQRRRWRLPRPTRMPFRRRPTAGPNDPCLLAAAHNASHIRSGPTGSTRAAHSCPCGCRARQTPGWTKGRAGLRLCRVAPKPGRGCIGPGLWPGRARPVAGSGRGGPVAGSGRGGPVAGSGRGWARRGVTRP
ncbi:Gfo/Idh/MocA family protein [Micromonosporaceae bacterium Da 78-11]